MLKTFWKLTRETVKQWENDNARRISAALAYYSVFSLAPLLLIAVTVAGIVFGEQAAQGAIEAKLRGSIGQDSASAVEEMVESARNTGGSGSVAIFGVGLLIFSATGVFAQLKEAMNSVWGIKEYPGNGIRSFFTSRFLSLSMVMAIGFLLIVSLVVSTALAAMGDWLGAVLPVHPAIWQLISFVAALAIITFLFALIFKILPDAEIQWRDVWTGAFLTALLFSLGKFLLALYLGREGAASAPGAAGALILILSWVFYTSNILLLGAEFTQVWAKHKGRDILPTDRAYRTVPSTDAPARVQKLT